MTNIPIQFQERVRFSVVFRYSLSADCVKERRKYRSFYTLYSYYLWIENYDNLSPCRCYDAVSEHPCRQWCLPQSHQDVFKAPVHQAALKGSFRTLSMFIRHRYWSIQVKFWAHWSLILEWSSNKFCGPMDGMVCWDFTVIFYWNSLDFPYIAN